MMLMMWMPLLLMMLMMLVLMLILWMLWVRLWILRVLSADSVHKVFSSTFEPIPNRRGEHPFRIARMSAIDAGIHAIRAGRHLCDEALRYLWTGTSRRYLNLFYALAEQNRISQPLLTRRWMHGYAAPHSSRYESN